MKRCFLTLPTGLFYRLISRQPPFCTFDDACNFFFKLCKVSRKISYFSWLHISGLSAVLKDKIGI